ncbi:Beta-N-acetylhexosaminidase [Sphingomonas sp. EC-HK361]|uniref:glycoside hydrolase family 3 N-terminal domain-containing protein n=1 Tax=Sphingomonas sp. EC-HK361 TaxID=2038397 RepID=UPI0012514268|nr:glycoside hydrolase family 3 N-terminal domain-containing protein [Sphingomonas sp. EC-HK361]VVT04417.1 Beta-N-acetylhexosaminidase [Sphingomonas sp. EC-HK361]
MTPAFFGLSGPVLTDAERAFFAEVVPAGFILFGRNVETKAQLRALTDSLRDLTGRDDLPVLIDQEGGPVVRMKPPVWPAFPAGPAFDALYEIAPMSAIEAMRANALALALMLREAGITVDCAPMLDLGRPETTSAVLPRALGREPMRVAALGRAMLDGLAEGGVAGVIKHMPGHGRAVADTHLSLPTVTASAEELAGDMAPFRSLANAPMGMTAHIVFTAFDAERPATLSPIVIDRVIRGEIGFDGLLMTDDIGMGALSGRVADRAVAALTAGVDVVLECSGDLAVMQAVAAALPAMTHRARERLARAMALCGASEGDMAAALAKRDALLALV